MKLFLLLLIIFSLKSFAQDSFDIIILSDKVGEVIDVNERNDYALFKQVNDFHSVIFYRDAEEEYWARFTLRYSDGTVKDSAAKYNEISLINISERINYFEEIKAGKYERGKQPVNFRFADSIVTLNDLLSQTKKLAITPVPINKIFDPAEILQYEEYPYLSVGIGLAISTADFDEVKNGFAAYEKVLRDSGYTVPGQSETSFSDLPLLYFSFAIVINENFSAITEITLPVAEVDIKFAHISFMYNQRLLQNHPLYLSSGAGAGSFNFRVEKKYNIPLKDSGGRLESIIAEGGKFGFLLTAGFKYVLFDHTAISLFANYYLIPGMETTIRSVNHVKLNLSSLSVGLKLSVNI